MDIDIKYLTKNAKKPEFKTDGSAAMDLYMPMDWTVIQEPWIATLGIAIHIKDPNVVGLIVSRSSTPIRVGVVIPNALGVIDSDYTGELRLILSTLPYMKNNTVHLKKGDRIAQIMFVPIIRPTFNVVDKLNITTRGAGGCGSTGE